MQVFSIHNPKILNNFNKINIIFIFKNMDRILPTFLNRIQEFHCQTKNLIIHCASYNQFKKFFFKVICKFFFYLFFRNISFLSSETFLFSLQKHFFSLFRNISFLSSETFLFSLQKHFFSLFRNISFLSSETFLFSLQKHFFSLFSSNKKDKSKALNFAGSLLWFLQPLQLKKGFWNVETKNSKIASQSTSSQILYTNIFMYEMQIFLEINKFFTHGNKSFFSKKGRFLEHILSMP